MVYALLEGGCQLLEISRDDIDGALRRAGAGVTTLVLFDVVPGGAGHVGRIAAELERVLHAAHRKVDHCECGSETSCYRCLRVFRNERFHDDLSRGSARDVLAAMLDLHAGRLCLVDTPSGRSVGTFVLDEDSPSYTLTDTALTTVRGPIADLQLIAASV